MTGERTTIHYVGDRCPGGHPELLPPVTRGSTVVELDGLLADLIAELHSDTDPWSAGWAARAQRASTRLHDADIHTAELAVTDWRDCPTCHMHPERSEITRRAES